MATNTAYDHRPDHPTADDPEAHHVTEGLCWACGCYSCGGRTDEPRIVRDPDTDQHPNDPSHRWCFE